MRLSPRALTFGGILALAVFSLGWYLGSLLGFGGWKLWVLRSAIWILGGLAAFLVYRLIPKKKRADSPPKGNPEIGAQLDAAKRHLLSAGVVGKGGFKSLPVWLFLGPAQSAKTSVVQGSGLEREFLAGDGDTGSPPPPTRALNLWYHRDTVFVEVGEPVVRSKEDWDRVLHAVKPGGWSSVFKEHPFRGVVLCVGSEWLNEARRDDLMAMAKGLRSSLAEGAALLDTRLPVYVIFTKLDEVPYFKEYVKHLSEEHLSQPLGVTLPLGEEEDPGVFGQWQTRRLKRAFDSVFRALASHRTEVLARDPDDGSRATAYEFPREFRKTTDLAVEFLVELTRPSQLRISHFLRGFYFSGPRPVQPGDARKPAAAPEPVQVPRGATMVFDPSKTPPEPEPREAEGGRSLRWSFLGRLFSDILLKDEIAKKAALGGPRTAYRKRFLMISGVAVVALLSLALTISYLGNRGLQREARGALASVEGLAPGPFQAPSVSDLQALDGLGSLVARLSEYDQEGPPLRLRWGLYSGTSILSTVRRVYFDRFRALLFNSARSSLLASLSELPREPTPEEYDATYDALKAYLITTQFPDSSSVSFLSPVLMAQWQQDRMADPEQLELVTRQFDLYSAELPHGNPYSDPTDNLLRDRVRGFLKANADEESFYAAMLSQANRQFASVDFNADFPGSARLVSSSTVIPGAFTRSGWDFVLNGLENAEDFFRRDAWVVGPDFFEGIDPSGMATNLRARYQEEYVQRWLEFLQTARVNGFGLGGAEGILIALSGPTSPLFQLLDLASENTLLAEGDSAGLPEFQPLHEASPPGTPDRLYGDQARPYLSELVNLATAVGPLAANPGSRDAQNAAAMAAQAAAGTVGELSQSFRSAPPAAVQVGAAVQSLLRSPIQYARTTIQGSDVNAMNARGQAFCRNEGQILSRFPFQIGGQEAEIGNLAGMLQGLSDLATEIEQNGQTPSAELRRLLAKAEQVSSDLLAGGGSEPRIQFLLQGQPTEQVPVITLEVDGQVRSFRRNDRPQQGFTWVGARAEVAALRIETPQQTDSLVFRGTWGVFRLFHQADWQPRPDGTWRVSWTMENTGARVQADLNLGSAGPLMRRGYFDDFSCPRVWVR